MATKTAIITGACSGMGLSLTEHLLSLENSPWRVVMADIQPPPTSLNLDMNRAIYVRVDVSSWSDNAALFKAAYNWPGSATNRIDFLAANAGTADKESVYGHFDLDSEPEIPNLKCVEVDLLSVFYALKLFIHYARKTQRDLKPADSTPKFNPKMVITASCVGQYHFPIAPQYCAAKHGLVGLTRSIGEKLLRDDNIAVNCIMPAMVSTNLPSQELISKWPEEYLTPTSTINRAFMELIDDEGKVEHDGKSNGINGEIKTGQSVEAVVQKLYYREGVESADESQVFLRKQAEWGGLWSEMYRGPGGVAKAMKAKEANGSAV
jgi:15-hydroxyprostaglandin dehydrogenase (NAD)